MDYLLDRFAVGDDCWPWRGSVHARGYGVYARKLAHRLVYEALVGQIPEDHQLHHRCENRLCVRPSHLQPVTQAQHSAIHHPPRPRRSRYQPRS